MTHRPSRRKRTGIAASFVLTLALALALPAGAAAAEPLKIREVFPGSTATDPEAEYVMLQMTADGQAGIADQELRFYAADGELNEAATYVVTAEDAEGLAAASQQRSVLFAAEAASALGGDAAAPDAVLPDLDRMSPAGGAACFTGPGGAAPVDCVSWGSFESPGSLLDAQSANAAEGGIADGLALERDISRGDPGFDTCLNVDSPGDDTGSSAADFQPSAPAPRNNAAPLPSGEHRCPPRAVIVSGPVSPFENPTNSDDASFSYAALPTSEPGVEFRCQLASAAGSVPPDTTPTEGWEPCNSPPYVKEGLADGFYRFWVQALGSNPEPGPPANRAWQVDTVAPQTSIDVTPSDPSDGFEAEFSYSSSEPFSSFRCQLDDGAIQVCGSSASSGSKSYFDLTDGVHTFRVWATDNAGNKDPSPATDSITVQRFLGDSTPPDTQILLGPSNPSVSPNAFFAYYSSEANSSFQCRLDGAPFAPCSELGASYGPLPNGIHSFEVRAIDRAGNVDSVPAFHSWRVGAAVPNTRFVGTPGGAVRSKNGKPVRLSFRFKADKPGSTFRCRLDLSGPYKPCKSPHRLKAKPGRHVFEVFAVDSLGNEEGSPAFRIFRVRAPGQERSFFVQKGRFLSSLSASISPTKLPRSGLRPVSMSFGSTFENLDGSDIPGLKTMTLKLARGGVLDNRGLPRCPRARLTQRSSAGALAACRAALVGRGTVDTALRFPEGRRSRATARLLLFNAGNKLFMHIYATEPVEGTFIVPLKISTSRKGRFATTLSARFPRIAAGFGQVTGFQMTLKRTFRHRGKKRSYLLGGCPAPRALNRVAFELARVDYRFRGGLRIQNSTINSCRAIGR
ncbi:MAG: hypothetical protein WDZ46_09815 [Solirubrobacterales bacterium]